MGSGSKNLTMGPKIAGMGSQRYVYMSLKKGQRARAVENRLLE
jgi:hypothetical protein